MCYILRRAKGVSNGRNDSEWEKKKVRGSLGDGDWRWGKRRGGEQIEGGENT